MYVPCTQRVYTSRRTRHRSLQSYRYLFAVAILVPIGGAIPPQRHHQQNGSETATPRTTGGVGEKGRIAITTENLPKMKNVVIMQDVGIIYCPVSKVMDERRQSTTGVYVYASNIGTYLQSVCTYYEALV